LHLSKTRAPSHCFIHSSHSLHCSSSQALFETLAFSLALSIFQQSFKGWKGKFFKVCCSDYDPSALDDFPLYWVKEVKTMKSKSLDERPSNVREVCQILTSVRGFETATLINLEFNADALAKYISMNVLPYNFLAFVFVGFLLDA